MPAHFSHRILLINPNSSAASTQMMLRIGRAGLDEGSELVGVTAKRAPRMILTLSQLAAAAEEVVEMATAGMADCNGLIVSAFGDPGLNIIRKRSPIPATGLCEASMLEAAAGGAPLWCCHSHPGSDPDYRSTRGKPRSGRALYWGQMHSR